MPSRMTWLIHVRDMTHPHLWVVLERKICDISDVTLIYDMTQAHVAWQIHICDNYAYVTITHSYVWRDTCAYVTITHSYICDVTHLHLWVIFEQKTRDTSDVALICDTAHVHVTWLIHNVTWLMHMLQWLIHIYVTWHIYTSGSSSSGKPVTNQTSPSAPGA